MENLDIVSKNTIKRTINTNYNNVVNFHNGDIDKSFILFINKSDVLTPVLLIQNIGDKIRGHGVSLCQMKESELNRQL